MGTVVKSIRLSPEEWGQLEGIADGMGVSLSRAVAALIEAKCGDSRVTAGATALDGCATADVTAQEPGSAQDGGGTGPSSYRESAVDADLVGALTAQLATKDEQIARLMDALMAAQDATRAAQALHAAETSSKAIEARTGRMAAWWERLTGRGKDKA